MIKIKSIVFVVLISLFTSLFQVLPTANAAPPSEIPPSTGTIVGNDCTRPYVDITFNAPTGTITNYEYLIITSQTYFPNEPIPYYAPANSTFTPLSPAVTAPPLRIPLPDTTDGWWRNIYIRALNDDGSGANARWMAACQFRTPGPATKLVIQKQSSGTTTGVAFTTQPQIALTDANGRVVKGITGTVTATISSGATLQGTVTATIDASTGVATFNNLGLATGTTNTGYIITYSTTGITSAIVGESANNCVTCIFANANKVPRPPSVSWSDQRQGFLTGRLKAPFNGGADITNYEYKIDSGSWTAVSPVVGNIEDVVFSIDLSGIVVGPHTFELRAVNIAGAGSSGGTATFNRIGGIADVIAPTLSSFSSTTTNGSYKAGSTINITATLSEAVTSAAQITVTLDTGETVLLSQSSTGRTLTGTYTVGAGKTSADLTVTSYVLTSAPTDASGNVMNSVTLPTGTNNIAGSSAIVIDTTAPTVTLAATSSTSGSATITFTVTGNEPITCSTLSSTHGEDFNFTGTGISTITGIVQTSGTVCTITATSTATNGGAAVTSTLTAASTFSMTDTAGNAQTALTGSPQSTAVTIDTTAPTVTLAATTATSGSGTVTFTVTGNEPIACSTLSTASGTDFTFSGITSLSGIVQTSPTVCTITAISTASLVGETATATLVAAGSFSITDTTGNAQTTLTDSPQSTSITVVDTTGPVLTLTSASAITSIAADLNFTSNEVGTYYFLVYAVADGPPDAATIVTQGTAIAKGTSSALAAANTANATGLSANTGYKAYVVVRDAANNLSAVSTIAFTTLAIVPGTPGAPTAVAGSGQATVTVAAPTTGGTPTSYTVTSSPGGATCTVNGASGSCTVTGLTNGTPYTFTSIARNTGGPSASASVASNEVTPFAPAPIFIPEPEPVCNFACVAAQNAAAAKIVADRVAAEAKVVSDVAAKVVAEKVVIDKTAAEVAAKTAVEKAAVAALAKAAADTAAVQAAAVAKAAVEAQAEAIDAANKATATLKSATTTAAAKAAATATAAKAATTAANAVKAAAAAAKTAATAKATATNASRQVDIAIGALGSKTAAATTAAQANAIAAAAKAAANEAAKAAADQASAAKVASNNANTDATIAAERIAVEQKEATDAASAAKEATDAALKATEEKIAAATDAQKSAENVVKALDEKIALAEASVKAKDLTERAAIEKKIEEASAKVAEAQRVADAANVKAAAAVVAEERAQAVVAAATQQAQVQAAEVVAVRADSTAKTAVAVKAAADASLAAKVAAAAKAAAAKVPSKAVISAKPSTSTNKNSAKATISGLKPGQKVKVTVNVKGK
jgi:hypothetical protein